jgi:predicted GIY-YIG superfamily endonuclease
MGENYQVHVLQNVAGNFYIGLSQNPTVRLAQHNAGVSLWTRNRGPWKRVWESDQLSLSAARKQENYLKRHKGGEGFYQFTGLSRSTGS